jgi:hypothetical protein
VNYHKLIFFALLCMLFSFPSIGQLSVVNIIKQENTDKKIGQRNAALHNLEPKSLPFWDDFSFSFDGRPVDTLWVNSPHVRISQGIGINPLSINVATFDGTDANGRPYSTTDPLATGLTDSLVSRALKLTEVPANQRTTVYLSFYYQYQGRGEGPDPNDEFYLEFRNDQLQWERVWGVDGSINVGPNVFNPVLIPVNQPRFFHDNFQFKFQSKGRQSGPFDTWNLDYIYLNRFRNGNDLSFPDRSIAAPLTSLFGVYWSVPFKHFIEDPIALMSNPRFGLYNLKSGFSQPINFDTDISIKQIFEDDSFSIADYNLDNEAGIGGTLQSFERRMVSTQTLPDVTWFDVDAKEIEVDFKVSVSTKDNVPPAELGDYEARYIPIDFRWNDTTSTVYKISDYYAYDDGEAEFAAGLNSAGGSVVYLFESLGVERDTLVSVDIHFPFVGTNESAQIDLIILRDLEDGPGSLLHMQAINIERKGNNEFVNYKLSEPIGVSNPFYVGWRQRTSNRIDVGLDKNNDTGNRMYFKTGTIWQQNITVQGSLMIRPRIGKGSGIITGIENKNQQAVRAWPNPSHDGYFFIKGSYNNVIILDAFGRALSPVLLQQREDTLHIDLSAQPGGMYILKLMHQNKPEIIKLIRQ